MQHMILFSSFKKKELPLAFMEARHLNEAKDLEDPYSENEAEVPYEERLPEAFRSRKALAVFLLQALEKRGMADALDLPQSEDWPAVFTELTKAFSLMLPTDEPIVRHHLELFVDEEYAPCIQQQVIYQISEPAGVPVYALEWVSKQDSEWGRLMQLMYGFLSSCTTQWGYPSEDDIHIDRDEYIAYMGAKAYKKEELDAWEAAAEMAKEIFLNETVKIDEVLNLDTNPKAFRKQLKKMKPATEWQYDLQAIAMLFDEFIDLSILDYTRAYFNNMQENEERDGGIEIYSPTELLFFGLGTNDPVTQCKHDLAESVTNERMFYFSHRQRLNNEFEQPYPFPLKLWEAVRLLCEFYDNYAKEIEDGLDLPNNQSIAKADPALV